MDLKEFSGRMYKIAAEADENIAKLMSTVAQTALEEVVRGTPVDTGLARSNWLVSLDAEENTVVPPHTPGRHLGKDETGNAEGAITAGKEVLGGINENTQCVYLQNNVDYIEELNNGSSAQAPSLFVEQAVDRAVQKVEQTRVVP